MITIKQQSDIKLKVLTFSGGEEHEKVKVIKV